MTEQTLTINTLAATVITPSDVSQFSLDDIAPNIINGGGGTIVDVSGIVTLASQVAELDSDVTVLEANVAAVQADVTALQEDVSGLDATVAQVQTTATAAAETATEAKAAATAASETAQYALNAGEATMAGSAQYALRASSSIETDTASTAQYALDAGNAKNAKSLVDTTSPGDGTGGFYVKEIYSYEGTQYTAILPLGTPAVSKTFVAATAQYALKAGEAQSAVSATSLNYTTTDGRSGSTLQAIANLSNRSWLARIGSDDLAASAAITLTAPQRPGYGSAGFSVSDDYSFKGERYTAMQALGSNSSSKHLVAATAQYALAVAGGSSSGGGFDGSYSGSEVRLNASGAELVLNSSSAILTAASGCTLHLGGLNIRLNGHVRTSSGPETFYIGDTSLPDVIRQYAGGSSSGGGFDGSYSGATLNLEGTDTVQISSTSSMITLDSYHPNEGPAGSSDGVLTAVAYSEMWLLAGGGSGSGGRVIIGARYNEDYLSAVITLSSHDELAPEQGGRVFIGSGRDVINGVAGDKHGIAVAASQGYSTFQVYTDKIEFGKENDPVEIYINGTQWDPTSGGSSSGGTVASAQYALQAGTAVYALSVAGGSGGSDVATSLKYTTSNGETGELQAYFDYNTGGLSFQDGGENLVMSEVLALVAPERYGSPRVGFRVSDDYSFKGERYTAMCTLNDGGDGIYPNVLLAATAAYALSVVGSSGLEGGPDAHIELSTFNSSNQYTAVVELSGADSSNMTTVYLSATGSDVHDEASILASVGSGKPSTLTLRGRSIHIGKVNGYDGSLLSMNTSAQEVTLSAIFTLTGPATSIGPDDWAKLKQLADSASDILALLSN